MSRLALVELEARTTPTAQLLADLNPFAGGDPRNFAAVGQTLFFSADDEFHGRELWKTDGTVAGTRLLKDLSPGQADTAFGEAVAVNGTLFFTAATSPQTGLELWKSDGTRAGTVKVGTSSATGRVYGVTELTRVGNLLYFRATDDRGQELWRSDGTRAGTHRVKDIRPGQYGSEPRDLTAVGGKLFFSAAGEGDGFELWKSNGTRAGTVRVKDIFPGKYGSNPEDLVARGGTLFFSARTEANEPHLWKSNGTAAGTVPVQPDPAGRGRNPEQLAVVGNLVYFTAESFGAGRELWRSNGTAAGTFQVQDIVPGEVSSYPGNLTVVKGTLFFTAVDGNRSDGVWQVPGSGTTGVTRVLDVGYHRENSARDLTALNGKLFFSVHHDYTPPDTLWVSDGTPAGTRPIAGIPESPGGVDPRALTVFRDKLYFSGADPVHGRGLWKSNGTAAGTVFVKDFGPGHYGSYPESPTVSNGQLFFFSMGGLYKTDGTPGSLTFVAPADRDFPVPSFQRAVADLNGTLYYAARATAGGKTLGVELWKSDGTAEGTVLVKDIWAAPYDTSSEPRQLTAIGDALYFSASDAGGSGGNRELWTSDGTTEGTVLVKDINPGVERGSDPYGFTQVGGTIVFAAEGPEGRELWKTDGTAEGTVLLKDIRPGFQDSHPYQFTLAGDTLYFVANDGEHGSEVWKTDGTPEGTMLVKDVGPDDVFNPPVPGSLTAVGDVLYFTTADVGHGRELWKTDGTPDGTVMVTDLRTGAEGSAPDNLIAFDGALYFGAFDGPSSMPLWKLDGSAAAPVRVTDAASGDVLQAPKGPAVAGGRLFVSAFIPSRGRQELWAIDATGAHVVPDGGTGTGWDDPETLTALPNGDLFFVPRDAIYGREPWVARVV
jgi:ELWxxDGT repeat protein